MNEKKFEIKGFFVYVNGKLIKPSIIKLKEVDAFPMKVNSSEIAYVDNVLFEENEYVYRIVVIPAKYIGKYFNRFPPFSYDKTSYFQILRGKAKIESFYEEGNGRYFYKAEDMINENTYSIERGSCVGIINTSFEKVAIAAKTGKAEKQCSPVYYIGENGYEQNPEKLIFGEKRIEKKEYSLIGEMLIKLGIK